MKWIMNFLPSLIFCGLIMINIKRASDIGSNEAEELPFN